MYSPVPTISTLGRDIIRHLAPRSKSTFWFETLCAFTRRCRTFVITNATSNNRLTRLAPVASHPNFASRTIRHDLRPLANCDIRIWLFVIVTAAIGSACCRVPQDRNSLAFPGAVGQGAAAVGGRGGDVYHVTNLSDYNDDKDEPKIQGSLRHAIRSATGPRTIVFDVGGAIKLHDRLEIRKSKLTIAGQTAPGGITIWGYPVEVAKASDIVIRYLRVRTGDFNARPAKASRSADKAAAGNGAKDLDAGTANGFDVGRSDRVIVDHVSAAWGMDETLSVTLSRNVTVQNSIIARKPEQLVPSQGSARVRNAYSRRADAGRSGSRDRRLHVLRQSVGLPSSSQPVDRRPATARTRPAGERLGDAPT